MTRGWQSGWHPATPPPQLQMWWWGPGSPRSSTEVVTVPAGPTTPVRIGDAERDRAASDLGDHFAAGRLSREEFDERADQAMQATFSTDLETLFADLPKPASPAQPVAGPPGPLGGPPPIVFWLVPALLVAAVVGGIVFHAPFLLWVLVWFVVIGRITGHKRRHRLSQRVQR